MTLHDLPAVNASLNALSAVLLTCGYIFIRRGNQIAHRNCMVTALITSALFLTGYLTYHYNYGSTRFVEPQSFRPYYLTLLLSHTILAVVIVPMILVTASRALRARFDKHKKIARWTWPLWMYVSVTGVIVYLILYQIYPQTKPAPETSALTSPQSHPAKTNSSRIDI
ncbi:MAG: putative rane protein [Verrucomicrobiales bacterium]|nr:putative rane protein [Verrucomicrobiales bacterium]